MRWKLVPEEPTPEMVGAFWRVKNGHHFHDEPAPTDTSDYAAYRAMLAASPPPPGVEAEQRPQDELTQDLLTLAEAFRSRDGSGYPSVILERRAALCRQAGAELSSLREEVERLTEERDAADRNALEQSRSFAAALSRLQASEALLEKYREALKAIGRRARSDGQRTFDDCIRDLGRIDDLARASLLGEGK